jgi:L-arabinonolactonase
MRIELLADVKTTLGEGPLWDTDEQRLYWIDSFDGRVFRCTADGREIRAWDVPQKIGSMALRRGGWVIVSLQRGFHTLDFGTGEVTLIHDPEPDRPANRLNDGKSTGRAASSPARWTRWRRGPTARSTALIPT